MNLLLLINLINNTVIKADRGRVWIRPAEDWPVGRCIGGGAARGNPGVGLARPRSRGGTEYGFRGQRCGSRGNGAKGGPATSFFTIDTGYLFPETLALKTRIEARYDIEIQSLRPRLSVPEQDSVCGPDLYNRDPDHCCRMRKVEPLQRKLASLNGWIASLRRDQSGTRAGVRVVEGYRTSGGRDVAKINPLAAWTRKQVWDYIIENDLPYNSLMDQGYSSIGCWPCTRPAAPGADERAGRWAGTSKSECGMHVPLMEVEIPDAEGQLAAG